MAASASTAFAVSTTLDLSSKAAFSSGSSNVAQKAPVLRSSARVVAVRASSNNSDEARPARREMLAGFVAAGVALGFSTQQAFADVDPVGAAKSKADQAVQGAKEISGSNPFNNLTAGNPLGDVQGAVDDASSTIKQRIDGLFGKNKPYPQRNTQVTGKGAIADAKGRVSDFLSKSQNPLATSVEKISDEAAFQSGKATGPNSPSAVAGKEFLGKDSTRVDEATDRVNAGAEKLKGKALQAVGDAKDAAVDVKGAATDAAPDVSLPTPQGSGLFKGLANKLDEAKSNLPGQ